jgi:hypothetical protein
VLLDVSRGGRRALWAQPWLQQLLWLWRPLPTTAATCRGQDAVVSSALWGHCWVTWGGQGGPQFAGVGWGAAWLIHAHLTASSTFLGI